MYHEHSPRLDPIAGPPNQRAAPRCKHLNPNAENLYPKIIYPKPVSKVHKVMAAGRQGEAGGWGSADSARLLKKMNPFGFRVQDFGSQISGFGFRIVGFGFWVSGSGLWVSGSGFWVWNLRCSPAEVGELL